MSTIVTSVNEVMFFVVVCASVCKISQKVMNGS